MNRIITTLAAVLMALAAVCQSYSDSTALTQQQWQHALAIVAQNNALNDGYGQATADFESRSPEGYTLDDLNEVYKGKRNWDATYSQLKKMENDGGTVARVKELAGGLARNVDSELRQYVDSHPAVADPVPAADTAAVDTLVAAPVQEPAREPQQQSQGMGMHIVVDIVLALLALGALAYAWTIRRSLDKLRDNYIEDMEAMNTSMQTFADDVARQLDNLRAESRQSAARTQTRVYADSEPLHGASAAPAPRKPVAKPRPRTLYLSKPDENECFIRATEEFELGNSIFVLNTTDGIHGEFSVIENRDVHRFALMMPGENLTRACSGNAIQMSAGMTRIITDREGEALFENGQWHVIVKAIIHYE